VITNIAFGTFDVVLWCHEIVCPDRGRPSPCSAVLNAARQPGLVFCILLTPFVLNDFVFAALRGRYGLYLADYGFRVAILCAICFWPAARELAFQHLRPRGALLLALLVAIALPLTEIPGAVVSDFVDGISGIGGVFRYPPIRDPLYYWFDLSAGLFLVALSEELVFRKLARQWLEALSFGPVASVLISAVVFGLVHWGGGAGQIAYAAMVGVAYMTAYLVFNRLWLLVLAHWLQNFLVFGPFDPF
jgi:membrane protease YdiL (CAAX protease family)